MKKQFKINEVSRLFNIGPDSLRYYEKIGLLNPKRDQNNYRIYSLNEIYQLNIIAEFRKLNIPLAQIKNYIEDLSFSNTLSVLSEESNILKEEIKKLQIQKSLIDNQIENLREYFSMDTEKFTIKSFSKRHIVELKTSIILDEEFDFSIILLQRKSDFKVSSFKDNLIGASFSIKDFNREIPVKYDSVFIFHNEPNIATNYLDKGNYLSYIYKGNYDKLPSHIENLKKYARDNNLKIENTVYETYLVDNRYTAIPEEFLTELQVRIL
ncbi:MerR family transcriptional regulator [Anaerosphaera multitolerans]|uniref:MerR family transcriptional regulator n=1 Tax=Anaerosphaera multitolerans TaxID=2487351 RepID=A0A437S4I6_9FIRM|nr:MerR family transcriptional regulator [Anaerosphaera multitolerans]RVU53952.1 MerR family transcriptional regulator [Anaerosphaera multitolerans]